MSTAALMTELRADVGVESPPRTAVVTADEVAVFETALGALRRTDDAGRHIAPPTFPTRLIIRDRPDWYTRLGYSGMYHAGESIVTYAPLVVGQEVIWTSTLTSILDKPGRAGQLWFLEARYVFRSAEGVPLVDVVRTRVLVDREADGG